MLDSFARCEFWRFAEAALPCKRAASYSRFRNGGHLSLEEEPHAHLHDALARLAVDAAKRR